MWLTVYITLMEGLKLSIFSHVTKGDLEDLRHAIELLDKRTERLQKTQRSGQAVDASLSRRIKAIEKLIEAAPLISEDSQDQEEDDGDTTSDRLDSPNVSRETPQTLDDKRRELRRSWETA
jgi:hypothetical protein